MNGKVYVFRFLKLNRILISTIVVSLCSCIADKEVKYRIITGLHQSDLMVWKESV